MAQNTGRVAGKKAFITGGAQGLGAAAGEVAAAGASAGAFALEVGGKDAAFVLTLAPGNYTLQIAGKAGAGGIALLEVYELAEL